MLFSPVGFKGKLSLLEKSKNIFFQGSKKQMDVFRARSLLESCHESLESILEATSGRRGGALCGSSADEGQGAGELWARDAHHFLCRTQIGDVVPVHQRGLSSFDTRTLAYQLQCI